MRLLLIRHGETIWNTEGRLQGTTDVPLSERGRAQAAQLAARLQGETITAIYSSDLQRASDTAASIAQPHNLPVQTDPRLREQAKGQWEGLTFAEIETQAPDALQRWQADPGNPPGEGGESMSEVVARLRAALAAIRAQHTAGDTVLLVSHGMSLRTLICIALDIDPMIGWQFTLGNTALSEIRFGTEKPMLIRLNDTCHLHEITPGAVARSTPESLTPARTNAAQSESGCSPHRR